MQFKDAKLEWARLAESYDTMAKTQKIIKKGGLEQSMKTMDFKDLEQKRFEDEQKARVGTVFSRRRGDARFVV